MKSRKHKPPELKSLRSVQLTFDLPQTKIKPGARVLVIAGPLADKTGRVFMNWSGHYVRFPGQAKTVERHLLVEIK